ncbi:hypothetical protein IHE44_0006689 [Lamprotornis superbus]|uniref:Uncharacterized protein n=1 Tax=Lamprotornis superbus TaxID=245042 RepID=A0A835NGS0_9PASS|nr:hypothetical protein IHE44_0006689 [Lamprotornis superbus]
MGRSFPDESLESQLAGGLAVGTHIEKRLERFLGAQPHPGPRGLEVPDPGGGGAVLGHLEHLQHRDTILHAFWVGMRLLDRIFQGILGEDEHPTQGFFGHSGGPDPGEPRARLPQRLQQMGTVLDNPKLPLCRTLAAFGVPNASSKLISGHWGLIKRYEETRIIQKGKSLRASSSLDPFKEEE